MMKLRTGVVVVLLLLTSLAWADSLELKNGSMIKGKFVSGSESEVVFQVGSSRQTYAIADILSLKFDSDRPMATSMSMPSEAPARSEALVPRPPAPKSEENIYRSSSYV